jgi:hypothetical protein
MPDAPDIAELKKRRNKSLVASVEAIRKHPEPYAELQALLQSVLSAPLDVSDYYRVATRLAAILEILSGVRRDCLFPYFLGIIDPKQRGASRYFRTACRDLDEQLREIEQFRKDRACLRRIK